MSLQVIKNPKISNIIGLLKKPDFSIVFGNVSDLNNLDITSNKIMEGFFSENYDHDVYITFVDSSSTNDLLDIITKNSYMQELDRLYENAFVAVYNFGENDLIIWFETSGFMIGQELVEENEDLLCFHSVPHFYPKFSDIEDKNSPLNNYVKNNQDILDSIAQILL